MKRKGGRGKVREGEKKATEVGRAGEERYKEGEGKRKK